MLVGATIVGSIELVWAGTVTPPRGNTVYRWDYPANGNQAVVLKKGEEMGRFKLGSTVINLFAKQAIRLMTAWHWRTNPHGEPTHTKLNIRLRVAANTNAASSRKTQHPSFGWDVVF